MPLFKYGALPAGTIEGDVTFPSISAEGFFAADGDVTLPLLSILGLCIVNIDGDIALPVLSAQGFFAAEGVIILPHVRISGKMQDEIYGEVRIPLLDIDSEIFGSSAITGDVFLHSFYISGSMQAECSITTPALRIMGTLQNQGVMIGTVSIPRLHVFGEIEQIQYLTGNVVLPVLSAAGTIIPSLARIIDVAASLPVLRVDGVIFNSTYSFSEDDAVLRYSSSRRFI